MFSSSSLVASISEEKSKELAEKGYDVVVYSGNYHNDYADKDYSLPKSPHQLLMPHLFTKKLGLPGWGLVMTLMLLLRKKQIKFFCSIQKKCLNYHR